MDCDDELGKRNNLQVMVRIRGSFCNELIIKVFVINGENIGIKINEFEYKGIMVRVISRKINPYGLVVNGGQMEVNYDDLISDGIVVSDEKYSKNIPIMPNKSKYFQLQ